MRASRLCHERHSKSATEKWVSFQLCKNMLICNEKIRRYNNSIRGSINIDMFPRWSPFTFLMCFLIWQHKWGMEYRTKSLTNYLEKFPKLRLLMEIRIEMYFEYIKWYSFAAHWIFYFYQVNINMTSLFASVHVEGRKVTPEVSTVQGKQPEISLSSEYTQWAT